MPHHAFLSYSSEDRQAAESLCEVLEAAGVRCWVAPRDVVPGMDYAEAIVDAIDQSRVFVLLLSSRSNASPHVRREAERAASLGMRIVPLRLENVIPEKSLQYFIGSSHWLDALAPPYEPHFQKAAAAIQRHLAAAPPSTARAPRDVAPAPGPPAAPAPQRPVLISSPAPASGSGGRWAVAAGVLALAVGGALFAIRARRHPAPEASVPPASVPRAAPPVRAVTQPAGAVAAGGLDGCGGDYARDVEWGRDALEKGKSFAASYIVRALKACPEGRAAQELLPRAKRLSFDESKKNGDEEARWGRKSNAAREYNNALRDYMGRSDDPEPKALRAAVRDLGEWLSVWGGDPDGCGEKYGSELTFSQNSMMRGNARNAAGALEKAVALCPAGKTAKELLPAAKRALFEEHSRKAAELAREGEHYRAAMYYRDALKAWTGAQDAKEIRALQAEITRLEEKARSR